jgi:thiol-disulfide isomerase/thioredoxin
MKRSVIWGRVAPIPLRFIGAILLFFTLAGLAACSQPAPPTDKLVVGEPLPDIALTSLDGGSARLSDYRGKLVVLNLWATWCEPCRREMPNLQQLSNSLDPQRFAVVAVAADEDEHLLREYLLDKGVTFASYVDKGGRISRDQLGVQLFPYTLLIAADGRLIQRYAGPREWQRAEVVELLQRAAAGDYSGLQ